MIKISPSILNVEKQKAVSTFYNLETAKVDYFHIDVMDGKFVQNDTLDVMREYALTLSHITNVGLDVHLMVEENLEEVIDSYIDLEPEIITIHYEAVKKDKKRILDIVDELHKYNIKVGLAINPDTEVEEIFEYCNIMHQILIMSVFPGKGGQAFIPETVLKIQKLKKFLNDNNLSVDIEVDGGINDVTCGQVIDAGANVLVAGTYIIKSENYADTVKKLRG